MRAHIDTTQRSRQVEAPACPRRRTAAEVPAQQPPDRAPHKIVTHNEGTHRLDMSTRCRGRGRPGAPANTGRLADLITCDKSQKLTYSPHRLEARLVNIPPEPHYSTAPWHACSSAPKSRHKDPMSNSFSRLSQRFRRFLECQLQTSGSAARRHGMIDADRILRTPGETCCDPVVVLYGRSTMRGLKVMPV